MILRYYYGGPLVIPPQDEWEGRLADSGFGFRIRPVTTGTGGSTT